MRALWSAASRPYLTAGRYPYHFARNKLRFDPVFVTLLRRGLIPDRARVIDLGYGQGLLAALLLAARATSSLGLAGRRRRRICICAGTGCPMGIARGDALRPGIYPGLCCPKPM